MSGLLVFRWLVPVFALAVAATVWVVGGPMAAGLCFIAFLLGVVTCELHHMRWTSVEEPATAAASDSAFLALMAAGREAAPVEAAPAPVAPPSPPKRNFQLTCQGLAIGSGDIRLELVERHRLHVNAAAERREARPEQAHEIAEPAPAEPASLELARPEPAEPVLELEPDMVELLLVPIPERRPEPAPRPARANDGPPPPKVTVLASPAPDRKRGATEVFRSSYVGRTPS